MPEHSFCKCWRACLPRTNHHPSFHLLSPPFLSFLSLLLSTQFLCVGLTQKKQTSTGPGPGQQFSFCANNFFCSAQVTSKVKVVILCCLFFQCLSPFFSFFSFFVFIEWGLLSCFVLSCLAGQPPGLTHHPEPRTQIKGRPPPPRTPKTN